MRALGVGALDLAGVPPGRVHDLARQAAAVRAQALARMPEARRVATLLACARALEVAAQDDALDLLDALLADLARGAARTGQRARLRTLRDLDAAALRLGEACALLLDPRHRDPEVREVIFARVPPEDLAEAVAVVAALTRPPGEDYQRELVERYPTVRRFLPTLLRTITFAGTADARPVLDALAFLGDLERQRTPELADAPLAVVTPAWRRRVVRPGHAIDRPAYTLCALEQLREGLRRRDLFVTPSARWGDPRAKLLAGTAWATVRPQVLRTLGRAADPRAELAALGTRLDDAYRQVAARLPANAAVRIERVGGRDRPVLTGLDKLAEPASLVALRERVAALLPRVDLPELLLEVQAWTGFAGAFTHLSEGRARAADLATSVCAVLLAEACNVGLGPLIRADTPALTRGRLAWVQQNYIRAETLVAANARLVDYQAGVPLARAWGGGEVASADGLRFVVPIRTLNAGPNPKYFGIGRGVTYYNFTADQFTGFHGIVIPGTLRDSLYILDGLLEQQTTLRPVELMADTAGYSDIVFGLFWLLGYQFSPRLADLGDSRFWRLDPRANYGALDGVARHRVNADLIAAHWEDLLRVAGSLQLGTVSASELLRALGAGGRPTGLARAIGELGRLPKTLHLLAFIDDETYRRRTPRHIIGDTGVQYAWQEIAACTTSRNGSGRRSPEELVREERALHRVSTAVSLARSIGRGAQGLQPLRIIEWEEERLRGAERRREGPQQRDGLEEALARRVRDLELREGFVAVLDRELRPIEPQTHHPARQAAFPIDFPVPEARIPASVEDPSEAQGMEDTVEFGLGDGACDHAVQHGSGGTSPVLAVAVRPVRLAVEVVHPLLVDAQQVLPAHCPGEPVVGHPHLGTEVGLDEVLPGLSPGDLRLADAERRVNALGLGSEEDPAAVGHQRFRRPVLADRGIQR